MTVKIMSLTKFPGLIDIHAHFRDPGATDAEDFQSGGLAAVAGGYTFVCDMPNTNPPTFTLEALAAKKTLAARARIGVGFHVGTDGANTDIFPQFIADSQVVGLKVYASETTGSLTVSDEGTLTGIVESWNSDKPILIHAEGDMLAMVLGLCAHYKRRAHACHVATLVDVGYIRRAKAQGQAISAGVTPHHLFLTEAEVTKLAGYGMVKPAIGTEDDQQSLWEAVKDGTIDLVESDHAPHTKAEKESKTPPYGVPGLETTLGLLFGAVHEGKMKHEDVIRLCHEAPKKLFSIPEQKDTYIEADPEMRYHIGEGGYQTKCGWSPFDGWVAYGKVQTVVFQGKPLLTGGQVVI